MTHGTKHGPRRAPGPAAATLAAILRAGCSSGHVGESWQCPLAKGGSCNSVAAADPAVPDAAGRTVLAKPLYRVRDGGQSKSPAETPCDSECGTVFDPFAWLLRLCGAEDGEDRSRSADIDAQTVATRPSPEAGPEEPAVVALLAAAVSSEEDLRTGEVVARIWIAPFVDANGVYREAAHVRVVLEPAGWRLK